MSPILMATAAVIITITVSGCVNGNKNGAVAKQAAVAEGPAFDSLKRPPSVADVNTETAASPAAIGDTVFIGVFEYSVEGISFRKTIASDAMRETAGGIFMFVTMAFTNKDRLPHSIDSSLVRLIDTKNVTHACSAPACDIITMQGKTCLCSKSCRPGETIGGTMVFDVPSREGEYRLKVGNGAWKESSREIRLAGPKDTVAQLIEK